MIAGLEATTNGDVHIAGRRVNELSPAERDIAMVFQFYALYPSLTVAESLAFPLHAENLTKSEIKTRVAIVADRLELGGVLHRLPRNCSRSPSPQPMSRTRELGATISAIMGKS